MSIVFDGDAAVTSDLATHRRARTTVADAEADYRADLVGLYVAARGDQWAELAVLAEARRYDDAHPDEAPVSDELLAIESSGEAA